MFLNNWFWNIYSETFVFETFVKKLRFQVLVEQTSGASKSDEVDRILSNVFTQYRKEVHPATNRNDGAIEVGLSIIPLFIDIVRETFLIIPIQGKPLNMITDNIIIRLGDSDWERNNTPFIKQV